MLGSLGHCRKCELVPCVHKRHALYLYGRPHYAGWPGVLDADLLAGVML
jgi:hypothetical protein